MIIQKNPKIWQFWLPKIIGIEYNLYYVPKIFRNIIKKGTTVLKISYVGKGEFYYTIRNKIITSIFTKTATAVITVGDRITKLYIKPLIATLIVNFLGLTFRFKLFLRVRGLGYKAYVTNNGKSLNLKLGLSHNVLFNFQNEMFATKLGQKDRMFSVEGNSWIILTNVIARIQNLKKIDFYRGKGIFKKFYNCKIKQSRKKKK